MLETSYYNSRYFNKVEKIDDKVVKSSTNLKKITAEYKYYYYLPNEVKRYFVQPFNFKIINNIASYEMECVNVKNLAQSFNSEDIDNKSFNKILNKIDNFKKNTYKEDKDMVLQNAKYLVLEKTSFRIKEYNEYKNIYNIIEKAFNDLIKYRSTWNYVLSHGDLCFSNILWIKEINMIKFIDPRGAMKKSDLFIDEYYDMAKMSHSIFGGYESIIYNKNIDYDHIKGSFIKYLKNKNICIQLLMVYEASLFLSMIPLHIDNKSNVEKFLNQSKKILNSIGYTI